MLPPHDIAHLEGLDLEYDVKLEAGVICVVLNAYPVPAGFNRGTADLLIRLPGSWPDGQPDMFWVAPELTVDGKLPAATGHFETHLGRKWQRWSRHLHGGWQAGDDLATWLRIVARELSKAVA
jgi:hypothetical protein